MTAQKGRRAVVLGGGIAGLAAAGVLARHFEEVTVVERDPYPEQPGVRPHAAQGAHVHVLLAGGLQVLSRLVPQLDGWLDERGLHEGDLTHHVRMANGGKWLPKVRSGIPFRPCTRPEIEHLLRRDVLQRPNITLLAGEKAEGLVGRQTITGVRLSRGGAERTLEADLVVDAMGRSSPSARWLEAAGTGPVGEDAVDAGVLYSSCLFEPPAGLEDDWILMAASGQVPVDPNMGALMRLGPGRMLAAFIAYGKPRAPRSPDELVARTAELSVPQVHRLLRESRPISEVTAFGNTGNRWRHYGKLPWFPDGFVSIGDAVCALNPRYGQGMTVAALGAERLDLELDAHAGEHGDLRGFSHHFQKRMEKVLKIPWEMALMEDRLWVQVFSGQAPGLGQRLVMKAMTRFLTTTFRDIDTFIRFMRVAHMLDAPLKMLSPRVLSALLKGGSGGPAADAPSIGVA